MQRDIFEIIKTRRSIRRYKKEIPDEVLIRRCIEAACYAPSSKDSQPWSFVLVKDRDKIKELSKTQPYSKFLENAPYVIVALADEGKSNHWLEDCSCAIMLLLLEAHSLGLGTCWNAVYHPEIQEREDYVRKVLDIDRRYRVIANIGIGYPDEEPLPKKVKSSREIILKVV
ncbi:MAG: NAD(P)H nitroreductase [Nitrospirae bacterium CG_4_10_14_0_8_um_filter_41_23]|nr:MAG: NAD(P)H nitroreductase [Nitrospirae bacterium CG11_big_fil_rev_8_21_14_0_20_41_14]PIV44813.1 MAG: NAD(P)H nitroreductase [Nitrospirae bacterium CG02_land_8_20_14_3_00_41_53]PIW87769.1 MAG: NAD(P)H nitroreductase [Nitrospirae bacterium CG_4_8_14_3_um_filter_41_47]PIY85992.1 MAG: NAD(P)H nitroreductase [Nitrospirae bacterium CG_4_10_14_0_8_um_filter_41_23]PJA79996.1 MAG: NAD(P)H nitroreductase [Nitrospirae bacterium CG_4_9_14_3_um_filter_41_27]